MDLVSRPFIGQADFERVVAFRRVVASRLANAPSLSTENLRAHYLEEFSGWTQEVRLWESDGEIVGIGETSWPDEAPELRVLYMRPRIHPDVDAMLVGPEMVAWAEAEAVEKFGTGIVVEATVPRESSAMTAMIESVGYEIARVFERMELNVAEPLPPADIAPGYSIRPLAGEREVDAWLDLYHASFQDHYDFHPFHRDARIKEMGRETQVPELDLVAEGPDGSLASFCWTTRSDVDSVVRWDTHLVGTAREHRRRGLASALLSETIARVAAMGGGTLDLTVDSTSETGANRVYQRLGFGVVGAFVDYRRTIS
jgi:ribosomal protein S18 acetylase RimI-like enzyme